MNDKNSKIAGLALQQTRELRNLVDTLNNTTVGSLLNDITELNNKDIQTNIRVDNLIIRVASIENALVTINTKLDNLDAYFSHVHSYEDTTIEDTTDGSGIASSTIRTTQGVA